MAQIPTPRSYSEILGDMIDAFLSRYGLRALKIGSPVLSMFESSAQSQLRSSEDIFTLLEATSLDQAKGVALDRIGADESVIRETQNPASGVVTIGDSSFTKISSKIFQGTPAPIVGSVKINVIDASQYSATGAVYLGRGSSNFEGPLAFTSKLPPGGGLGQSGGNYWTLVLSTGTLRFHNLGESVILAQGGDRDIGPGTIVQTPQGATVDAVQFRVLYKATIPDGETVIDGVTVIALKPGTIGNVPDGAVSNFSAEPFDDATVTNAQPFTNGVATETDDSYRERIRQARASRVRGTALALQTFAIGVSSPDENKRVLSASVVARSGQPTVLYVDDGTGYEMSSSGIAIETFMDEASGGEDFFKISAPRPITKAFVLSTEVAPFTLASGNQWAFTVGGTTTVHTVDASQFRSIANATAYEWVASVNANPALNWNARTYANGTQVAVFAKADTNESIQYAPFAVDVDGNAFTGFGLGRVDTMRLYKNDRLLNKDGQLASITANGIAHWGSLGPTEDLQLAVDGTPLANLVSGTYTFTAADFINARTGYTTVGRNSPQAWAAVFNARIPGITATVVNGLIVIVSNLGASARAQLDVVGGSLVSNGMFALTVMPVVGANSDYTLDRNTGEIQLATPLTAGDRLAAGSVNTRAFIETPAWSTITVSAAGANFWFAADAGASIIAHGLTASTPLTISTSSPAWGKRERFTAGSAIFSNLRVGDWAIFWDSASPADVLDRAFRICGVDVGGTYFEIERVAATVPGGPVTFVSGGLTIVRTAKLLQQVTVAPGANYTASGIAPLLDNVLVGAQATVYHTTALRVNTATFAQAVGDIALVAADTDAQKFGLPLGNSLANITGHLASIESGNGEIGTPDFHQVWGNNSATNTQPQLDWNADTVFTGPSSGGQLVGLRSMPDGGGLGQERYSSLNGFNSTLASIASAGGTLYNASLRVRPYEVHALDRWYMASGYRLASDDSLTVLVDNDTDSKRFTIPMWRDLTPVGTTYATTNAFTDGDNGGQSLAVGFGFGAAGFDFNDYAVFMHARAQTHLQGDATHYTAPPADLTKTILWRYFRLGPDGNMARVSYALPVAPSLPVAVRVTNATDQHTDISVVLASGARKTGYALAAANRIGQIVTASASGVSNVAWLLGLATSTAQRTTNVTTITVNFSASGATDHNFQTGDQLYVRNSSGSFPDGVYTITRVSASQFSYADVGANAGPTSITGTVSYGTSEATLTGASPAVVAGDFMTIGPTTAVPAAFQGPVRVDVVGDPQTLKGVVPSTQSVSTVVTWYVVGDVSAVAIYANAAQTATAIAGAVNALAAAPNSVVPITGALIGNGTGIIDKASYAEAASATAQWFSLTDGFNYVNVTTVPGSALGNYQLSFKGGIAAGFATNSDWGNETVRIVPRTAKNVVDWFNAPTVSGLFSAADVERSSNAHKIQIASLTPGSTGSIQVQGGTANSLTAAVVGSASLVGSNYMLATVPAADVEGLMAFAWVSIDNAEILPKPVFVTGTVLQAITNVAGNSVIQISGSTFYTTPHAAVSNALVSFERQGNFFVVNDTTLGTAVALGTLAEGDYIRVTVPGSYTYVGAGGYEAAAAPASGNVGIFRVVRVVASPDFGGVSVWFENAAGVEQALTEVNIGFFNADAVMPGDTLSISTPLWDGAASNQGPWTVVDVGNAGSGSFLNSSYITVRGLMSTVGSPTAALGTSYRQVQMIEGAPARLIKQVLSVVPNQNDGSLYDIKFTTSQLFGKVGSTPGSIITVLDKLAFDIGIARGVDGYQHTTGLIAEVTKVIQGDPSDDATYPGVAAAGATVNVLGPLTKRIQVALSIRVRSGSPDQDIEARVKSAVASVINKTPIGTAIALSDLTNAASKVGGVISAVMVSPVATAGADLISIQAYEKPLVLNVDQDVLVSFAGA